MRSRRRNRFLRSDLIPEPVQIPEDRTEHEEARRMARDWLRERDDETAIDFEPDEIPETACGTERGTFTKIHRC